MFINIHFFFYELLISRCFKQHSINFYILNIFRLSHDKNSKHCLILSILRVHPAYSSSITMMQFAQPIEIFRGIKKTCNSDWTIGQSLIKNKHDRSILLAITVEKGGWTNRLTHSQVRLFRV